MTKLTQLVKVFFALYMLFIISFIIFENNIHSIDIWKRFTPEPMISKPVLEQLKRSERGPPIVVPKYKLIFFWNQKSACSYWKRIFQYIQGIPKTKMYYIHTPERSGLTYLDDYSDVQISSMMNDRTWTKATFVREPRERILSAYLDKAVHNNFLFEKCNRSVGSFVEFLELIKTCKDPHWETQVRIPPEYYTGMVIGYMADISTFTKTLLIKIGAYNSNVARWLKKKDLSSTRRHATNARQKIIQHYNPDLEKKILTIFNRDYVVFGFDQSIITK